MMLTGSMGDRVVIPEAIVERVGREDAEFVIAEISLMTGRTEWEVKVAVEDMCLNWESEGYRNFEDLMQATLEAFSEMAEFEREEREYGQGDIFDDHRYARIDEGSMHAEF